MHNSKYQCHGAHTANQLTNPSCKAGATERKKKYFLTKNTEEWPVGTHTHTKQRTRQREQQKSAEEQKRREKSGIKRKPEIPDRREPSHIPGLPSGIWLYAVPMFKLRADDQQFLFNMKCLCTMLISICRCIYLSAWSRAHLPYVGFKILSDLAVWIKLA